LGSEKWLICETYVILCSKNYQIDQKNTQLKKRNTYAIPIKVHEDIEVILQNKQVSAAALAPFKKAKRERQCYIFIKNSSQMQKLIYLIMQSVKIFQSSKDH